MNIKNLINSIVLLIIIFSLSSCVFGNEEQNDNNATDTRSTQKAESTPQPEPISDNKSEALPTFTLEREKPINGKLKAIVEMGAQGFNYFVVELDSDKNWLVKKKEFGNSLVKAKMANGADIKESLKEFITQIISFGVESKNVHFIISSGAMKEKEILNPIILGLKSFGYIVNIVTPEKEALYAYNAVMPASFNSKSFAVDIGSGNTKIAYYHNSKVNTIESYGSQEETASAISILNKVTELTGTIPKSNTEYCFLIGGVPFEMAKTLRKGEERFTLLKTRLSDYNELTEKKGNKVKSGLNIFEGIQQGTGCKQFIFDWDANFSIGFLLSLPY